MTDLMPYVLAALREHVYTTCKVDAANIDEAGKMRVVAWPAIRVTETVNTDVSSIHGVEKLTAWGCQVDVYAKNVKPMGRVAVARGLAGEVADVLRALGLRRTIGNGLPYEDDISRYMLRFDCDVTAAGYIYRP